MLQMAELKSFALTHYPSAEEPDQGVPDKNLSEEKLMVNRSHKPDEQNLSLNLDFK